jgi:tetratricopeptide (TPR) repeat protein
MTQQRLSRKEIKHDIQEDAFRHGVAETFQYVAGHRRLLVGALVGVLALVALFIAVRAYMASRERASSELLGRAERVLAGPIVTSGAEPEDDRAPSFPDDASRTARAKALFEELREEHGGTAAGAVATVYLGHMRHQAGDVAGARELWGEFLDDHDDHMLASGVRVSLLELDRQEGRAAEVAERLRADLERGDKPLPEDVLLFELARTLEQLGNSQEAREVYQRLGDEYPDSPFASQAQAKARELGPQSDGAMQSLQLPS